MKSLTICRKEKIYLWNEKEFPLKDETIDQYAPALIPYPIEKSVNKKAPVMLVCPGGGFLYKELYKEGEQIAAFVNNLGMYAFVLDYRTIPYVYPCQIMDIQRSIRFIRFNAAAYGVDPDKICAIGFSAGGMMASFAAAEAFSGDPNAADPVDRISAQLNGAVLCYPATSFRGLELLEELFFAGSTFTKVPTGWYDLPGRAAGYSCPVFCWTTCMDQSVPSIQSLELTEQLIKNGKDVELHIYEDGLHGLSLSKANGTVAQWKSSLIKWLLHHDFNITEGY